MNLLIKKIEVFPKDLQIALFCILKNAGVGKLDVKIKKSALPHLINFEFKIANFQF